VHGVWPADQPVHRRVLRLLRLMGDGTQGGVMSEPYDTERAETEMRYATILVDPPWPQRGAGAPWIGRGDARGGTGASGPMPYRPMTVPDIARLPVGDLAARDAHLYLWTTNGFLPAAFSVLGSWGFHYSTTLVWAKAPMGGGLGGCYGISTEFLLFARRGSLPAKQRVGRTWFTWKRAYDQRGKPRHSAKPGDAHALIEQVSPGPYVELFARDARPGWDHWGDQSPEPITWATEVEALIP
jgi:N6-adenosine-specific RNA methylase IME4